MPSQLLTCISWLGVVMVVAACTSCGQAPNVPAHTSTDAASGRTPERIMAAIRGAPRAFSQLKDGTPSASITGLRGLQELVHAGLVHADNRGNLHPQLAEAVPSIENGLWKLLPDGRMETTWRINRAARWHDGAPLTTDDLLFATTIEQDRDLGIPRNPVFDLIESVEAPDLQTIIVKWKQPYIEADTLFTYEVALPLPRHLLESAYAGDKASFLGIPYWSNEFVGAGPYKIREWVAESHVVLQSNDLYVLGRPRIDEIEVRLIPDPNTLLANLFVGVELTIDSALSLEQWLQIQHEWTARGGTVAHRAGGWIRVAPQFINASPPVVTDLRFRRAVLHAIDREEIGATLMGGLGGVAHSFVNPSTPEFEEIQGSIVRYDYDPRRAVQMIEEVGYRRGSDGAFRDAAGERLSVEIRALDMDNPVHPKALAIVADYWQQVGVAVEQVLVGRQRAGDAEYSATFPAFNLHHHAPNVATRGVIAFHGASAPLPENRFVTRGNAARYMNAELDALIDRYITTIARPERVQLLGGIVHQMTDQVAIMGIVYSLAPTMIGSRLQNVTASNASGSMRTTEGWNAHEWELRS